MSDTGMVITSSFMSTCPTRASVVASLLRLAVALMAASWVGIDGDGLPLGPPGRGDAPAQVDEVGFWNVDARKGASLATVDGAVATKLKTPLPEKCSEAGRNLVRF